MDAFILFSVKIGNDAVTLDRSGVTKDIPPYAIVVVNLAKIVKYTF
jgi:acetyltransferase-like isoleucine patch superfamily enzyme